MKRIIIWLLIILVVAGISGGTVYFFMKDDSSQKQHSSSTVDNKEDINYNDSDEINNTTIEEYSTEEIIKIAEEYINSKVDTGKDSQGYIKSAEYSSMQELDDKYIVGIDVKKRMPYSPTSMPATTLERYKVEINKNGNVIKSYKWN